MRQVRRLRTGASNVASASVSPPGSDENHHASPEALCQWAEGRCRSGRGCPRTLGTMSRKKMTIRPPGLKPTTKVGTLGPYRGRLGLAWVIAPVVVGVLILIAGYFALFH